MGIKCKGCGIPLQFVDANKLGYSPKIDAQVCQRCFRLSHYDDLMISMKRGIDEEQVLTKATCIDGLIVWVMDCFDLEAGILSSLNRHFIGRDLLVVLTKCDLLPKTLSRDKLRRFTLGRLKQAHVDVSAIALVDQRNHEDMKEFARLLENMRQGRNILILGKANAGKSTLINRLMQTRDLTVARYPGTTLDFNELQAEGYLITDTPGLLNKESLLMVVKDKDLKMILPDKSVKPKIFQVWEDQSYAIGGLARVDCSGCHAGSVVFYISNQLEVHRGKIENAQNLWLQHQGEILNPTVEEPFTKWKKLTFKSDEPKWDIVIYGLGWICVSGINQVQVSVPSNVTVIQRKAMI